MDPDAPHTDHTREYAPLLASFAGHGGRRHDGPLADVGASVLRWLAGARRAGAAGDAVRVIALRRVCVFCGSSPGARPAYAEATAELARLLAARRDRGRLRRRRASG